MKSLETGELSALVAEAEKIGAEAGQAFGHLSPAQLNWKPSAEEWSVGQCFEHLLLTNRPYFPLIEKIVAGRKTATAWERVPLLPRFFGKMVRRAVSPESSRKVKARPNFRPQASAVDPAIINQFTEHQRELVRLMQATAGLELESIVITSPVAAVVTYSLMDGYRIIVTHERRHFLQAERVRRAAAFPA